VWGCKNGHDGMVKLLVEWGDVDVKEKDKALGWAIRYNYHGILELLRSIPGIEE
jgi:hypothetical protein